MNLAELTAEAFRLSRKIDAGVTSLNTSARQSAEAEREYRKAKAQAWALHTEGTAKEREAQVDATPADLRYVRDLADAGRQASLEALRSRRAQSSMVQSLIGVLKSETEFAKYGPEVGP